MRRRALTLYGALAFGYTFLYLPIVLLVLNSFNASRISSTWGGFSWRWYAALLDNDQVIEVAAEVSTTVGGGGGGGGGGGAACSPA